MRNTAKSRMFAKRALALSIASALLLSQKAWSQNPAVEEIAITGSRIRQTDGMATPRTRSGPSASTAMAAVSAESMPPLKPRHALEKPDLYA